MALSASRAASAGSRMWLTKGVPGAGGHAGRAAFPAGVLDQVVRDRVPVDLAHAGPGGAERCGGAVQLGGGVGQGLLEPVARRLGPVSAGEVAGRGGAQQVDAQRGAGTEPGRIQRRGQHRPPVRAAIPGTLPAGDQLRRGCQGLGQAISVCGQRQGQPPVPGSRGAGPVLFGRGELLANRTTLASFSTSRSQACGSTLSSSAGTVV